MYPIIPTLGHSRSTKFTVY